MSESSAWADKGSVNSPSQIDQALLTASTGTVAARKLDSAMIGLLKWPYSLLEKSLHLAFDYGARLMATWIRKKGAGMASFIRQSKDWFSRKIWTKAPNRADSGSNKDSLSASAGQPPSAAKR